jgi:segregation and condensation protein B
MSETTMTAKTKPGSKSKKQRPAAREESPAPPAVAEEAGAEAGGKRSRKPGRRGAAVEAPAEAVVVPAVEVDSRPEVESPEAPPATGGRRRGKAAEAAPAAPEPDAVEALADDEADDAIDTLSVVEALLLASDAPLKASRISQVLGIGGADAAREAIDALNQRYEQIGCSFRIQAIAGGYQIFTQPQFDPWLGKLHKAKAETRLSGAALEALAIIAYRQPIIRSDIEVIRGVACGEVLVRLREMKLIKMVGRAEVLGRPMLYGTTPKFLEVFGLSSLQDLPKIEGEDATGAGTLKLVQPVEASEEATENEPSPS